jgi:uncharacterized phage protein (TIGR01671 family)
MNRLIKFRAWVPLLQKMFYSDDMEDDYTIQVGADAVELITYDDTLQEYVKIEADINQFTGLTDRHGIDIYEGDVLCENDSISICFEVKWASSYCKFKLDWTRTSAAIQYPEWNRGIRMSVIGNIHQNPHLLINTAHAIPN